MKTIIATRKTRPISLMPYGDTVKIIDDRTGLILFHGNFSTNPNPTAAAGKFLWWQKYAQIAAGSYRFKTIANHPKYRRSLIINNGQSVPTTERNKNQQNRKEAKEIFIHRGYKETWRGSAGCLTVPPSQADRFFSIFKDNEEGTLIIKDETKQEIKLPLALLGIILIFVYSAYKGKM